MIAYPYLFMPMTHTGQWRPYSHSLQWCLFSPFLMARSGAQHRKAEGAGERFPSPLNFRTMRLLYIPVACPQALFQNSWNVVKRIQCNMLFSSITLTIPLFQSLAVNPYTSATIRSFVCPFDLTGHLLDRIVQTLISLTVVSVSFLYRTVFIMVISSFNLHSLSYSSLFSQLICLCVLTFDLAVLSEVVSLL